MIKDSNDSLALEFPEIFFSEEGLLKKNKKRVLLWGMLKQVMTQVPFSRHHFREDHISLRHPIRVPLLRKLIL